MPGLSYVRVPSIDVILDLIKVLFPTVFDSGFAEFVLSRLPRLFFLAKLPFTLSSRFACFYIPCPVLPLTV
jgi:hypothetical protein